MFKYVYCGDCGGRGYRVVSLYDQPKTCVYCGGTGRRKIWVDLPKPSDIVKIRNI